MFLYALCTWTVTWGKLTKSFTERIVVFPSKVTVTALDAGTGGFTLHGHVAARINWSLTGDEERRQSED